MIFEKVADCAFTTACNEYVRSFELLTIERLFDILATLTIRPADDKGNEVSLKT